MRRRRVDWASKADIALGSTAPTVAREQGRAAPDARKVVYAANHKPVLAWESTVTGTAKDGTPIRNLVYTDARTGKQLAVLPQIVTDTGTGSSLYSGTVSLTTTPSGSSWTLTDGTRGGHKTYDATGITSETDYRTGTLFSDTDDVWGTGTTSSKQSAAVDAHYGAALTWDFYKNTFGRNGIRNNGVAAFSRVHFGNSYENAFWDDSCFCMTYGDGGSTFKPARRPRRGRPRDVARRHRGDRRARLLRRRRRPQRVDLRRDGHDGGVLGQQRHRPR